MKPQRRLERDDPADIGAAMVAAAHAAGVRVFERRDGSVECAAWFRGGDGARKLRIWQSKGAAHDIVTGTTYNGHTFARAIGLSSLDELMRRHGRTTSAPTTKTQARSQTERAAAVKREPQIPSEDTVSLAWKNALESAGFDESPAGRWLAQRGIPAHLTRSGFVTLDAGMADELQAAPARGFLLQHVDTSLVAPIRSASTGAVCALQVRAFDKKANPKRVFVGRMSDEDGTPRAYGRPDLAPSASVVVLVEGMADTFAAEAMTAGVDGLQVVGADSAGALSKIATWLQGHSKARVVIVRHVDKKEQGEGVGQAAADEASKILGVRAVHLGWAPFAKALRTLRVDMGPLVADGFDLADVLRVAKDSRADFDRVSLAFLDALQVKRTALPSMTSRPGRAGFRAPKRTPSAALDDLALLTPSLDDLVKQVLTPSLDDLAKEVRPLEDLIDEIWGIR